VLPFRSALVGAVHHAFGDEAQAAIGVQPMAVTYTGFRGLPLGRELRERVAWYGDAELIPHFIGLLSAGAIDVTVSWGEPIAMNATSDRKAITRDAEQSVRRMCEAARRAGIRGALAARPTTEPVAQPGLA
jgi:1-acyl-sn-glycerol-3-phosphate acyltransferase